MWKSTFFVTCLLLTSSLAGLTACKSDTEKRLDRAQELVANYKAVGRELDALGTPSTSWSEEQLNYYDAKLDHLQNLEAQLKAMRGCSDGVCVGVGDTTDTVATIKAHINDIRSAKTRSSGSAKSIITGSLRLIELEGIAKKQHSELTALGKPNATWPIDSLQAYLLKLGELRASYAETARLADDASLLKADDARKLKERMQKNMQILDGARDEVNQMIGTAASPVGGDSKAMEDALDALGKPDVSWTVEKLADYIKKCAELTASLQSQAAAVDPTSDQKKMLDLKIGMSENRKNIANAVSTKKMIGTLNTL